MRVFCINLNTYLWTWPRSTASFFPAAGGLMNGAVRAARSRWWDSLKRSLVYKVAVCPQESLGGDEVSLKTNQRGRVPEMLWRGSAFPIHGGRRGRTCLAKKSPPACGEEAVTVCDRSQGGRWESSRASLSHPRPGKILPV